MVAHRYHIGVTSLLALLWVSTVCLAQDNSPRAVEFHVKLSKDVCKKPLSGRLYVALDRYLYGQPLSGPDGSDQKPFFATDVRDWKGGEEYVMKGKVAGFPCALDELPDGVYAAQALLDTNTTTHDFVDALSNISGCFYSRVTAAIVGANGVSSVSLSLSNKGDSHEFVETDFMKEARCESELLSAFYGRPVTINAAILLPPSYGSKPDRKYPTVFVFPAFGRRYYDASLSRFHVERFGISSGGREKVVVFLDQSCPLGCHVFANSENNGPWARAFVEEFLPYLESNYRVFADGKSRFMIGQSSGAWASLWLQINYPDKFAGAWASSPDPVDFTSFEGCNIYEPGANMFFSKTGDTLALPKLLSDMDRVYGKGWQMSSFEAVFSPRGTDNKPCPLWNRETGAVDARVAEAWRKYDIRNILESNWATLSPVLAGKLHIFIGDNDRFNLYPPVKSLQEALSRVNAVVDITVIPKGGHDLWNNQLRKTIQEQIDTLILAAHPESES